MEVITFLPSISSSKYIILCYTQHVEQTCHISYFYFCCFTSDACAIVGTPWVYSAILAFEGQLSVFNWGKNGPDYRDLLPTPPPPGDVPSCAEGGVLGVLPGTMVRGAYL
jgi:hypothetical protein